MVEYCQKIFRSFLEKFPEYIPPSLAKQFPTELTMLKPSVTSVELHSHDNELAVVVEGSNLWFCYQISIGGHTVQTPAHDLSGTSIQFNIQKEESKVKVEEGKVMAVLYSLFSKKPLSEEVPALQKVSVSYRYCDHYSDLATVYMIYFCCRNIPLHPGSGSLPGSLHLS